MSSPTGASSGEVVVVPSSSGSIRWRTSWPATASTLSAAVPGRELTTFTIRVPLNSSATPSSAAQPPGSSPI